MRKYVIFETNRYAGVVPKEQYNLLQEAWTSEYRVRLHKILHGE